MSHIFDDETLKVLRQPLDPKHVKPAPRGKFGDYVDGYHVVTEANRIFGEDGWSYTVTRLEQVSQQIVDLPNKGPQFRVGWMATVRVDVRGVIREGCAVGSGMGNPDSEADHHESAIKEAETDALKRALRCFGNTFGLALYEKEKTQVRPPEPERNPRQIADSLIAVITKAQDDDALTKTIGSAKFDAAWQWLAEKDEPKSLEVRSALEAKREEFGG